MNDLVTGSALARQEGLERNTDSVCRLDLVVDDPLIVPFSEARDLDENTLLDVDAEGNICAMTIEHASVRAGSPEISCERVPA